MASSRRWSIGSPIGWPSGGLAGWLALLAALTLVRLVVAGLAPLSADESYYWVWSRALAPGYLDHPPMVALWIRLGTWLCGDGPLGVRLLGPLSAAVGTLLLASAAADLGGPDHRAGRAVVAGVSMNATLLLAVGSVTMTPDTPLLFFWTLALAALARALATARGAWWLAAGLAIGAALDSKYTAFLAGAGLAGWLLATGPGRAWLLTPWPWLAALLSLALFLPVLDWNAAHGWASFVKQGGRTGDWHPARAGRYLGELLGGQIGLATPLLFVLAVAGQVRALRAAVRGDQAGALLAWVTLLPVAVFVEHAFGDRVQANWPGLLYPSAIIALSLWAASWWRWAAGLGLALALPVYLQAAFAPFPLPRSLDVTLQRLAGWQGLADQAAAIDPGFVAADEYGLAAELARALPGRLVIGAEPRWRLFDLPHPWLAGREGVLLRLERRKDPPDARFWTVLGAPTSLVRERAGHVADRYLAYTVRARSGLPVALQADLATLPSPH